MQPRFMLIEGRYVLSEETTCWLVVSSSNKVAEFVHPVQLERLILNGTVRPNNFGHSYPDCMSGRPEEAVLRLNPYKSIEHHGYFRTLAEVRDYIKMEQLLK